MALSVDVVKRGKRANEDFSRDKLHGSVYATCLSVRSLDGHATDTATHVCNVVLAWADNKAEVTSADIRAQASKALEKVHPDAAYLYKHHKQII